MEMEATRQARVDDTSVVVMLYMALELSGAKWKVAIGDGKRRPSQHTLKAADVLGLLGVLAKAKKRCGLSEAVRVMSCYEAGRDGFWLHRWLLEQGIGNLVVDSSSIEVNRRARRAKSDGLDAAKLYEMLVRYAGGETRVWRVVRVPTVEQEDARRLHRELERLKKERNAHVSRMRSLAVLHNVRLERIGGRGWAQRLEQLQGRLPAALGQEIARESRRLELVSTQIGALERERQGQLEAMLEQGGPLAALMRLRAIGVQSAWVLVRELFGWRRFGNRRELAGCVGVSPSPYDSGQSEHCQGISKAGNARVRKLLVEIAWYWLRYQPHSALSQWFGQPLWRRGQAHAPHRHRSARQAPAGGAVALPRAWGDPRRGTAQGAARRGLGERAGMQAGLRL
jgi:transposase